MARKPPPPCRRQAGDPMPQCPGNRWRVTRVRVWKMGSPLPDHGSVTPPPRLGGVGARPGQRGRLVRDGGLARGGSRLLLCGACPCPAPVKAGPRPQPTGPPGAGGGSGGAGRGPLPPGAPSADGVIAESCHRPPSGSSRLPPARSRTPTPLFPWKRALLSKRHHFPNCWLSSVYHV